MLDDTLLTEKEALIAGEVERFLRDGGFVGEKGAAALGVVAFDFPQDVSPERILREVSQHIRW